MVKTTIFPTHDAKIVKLPNGQEYARIEEVNPKILKILTSSAKITISKLTVIKGSNRKGNDQLIFKLNITKGLNNLEFVVIPNPKWSGLLVKNKEIVIRHKGKTICIFKNFDMNKIVSDLAKIPNQGLGI